MDTKLAELIQEPNDDKEYQEIIKVLLADASNKSLPQDHPGREYGSVWKKLSVEHGLLLMNGKMVISQAHKRSLSTNSAGGKEFCEGNFY